MKVLLLLFLLGCSPTYWAATKRCPTATMKATDFLVVLAGLTISGLHWSQGRYVRSSVEGATGLGLWTATNIAEVKCAR